jgi:filamentous hemagglutinin family protein
MKDIQRSNLRLQWIARRFQQVLLSTVLLLTSATAQAQITPDNSLGAESSIVAPLAPNPVDGITGGAVRGRNLFHSFQQFNVGEGRGAYFFIPTPGIENVLARVTGGQRSTILGTIGTVGSAQPNLFLINPNGIFFGPNASLDVGRSFVATTATGIQFGDQGIFSATNPQAPPLLTINPSALLVNRLASSSGIVNQSIATVPVLGSFLNGTPDRLNAGLDVPNGQSLLLVSDAINPDAGAVRSASGRVELGAIATGTVPLEQMNNALKLAIPATATLGNLTLNNRAFVVNEAGGTSVLTGDQVTIDNSTIGSGNLQITAGALRINNGLIGSNVFNPSNTTGNIDVQAGSVSLVNSRIASSFGQGDSGRISFKVTGAKTLDRSLIFSNSENNGKAGDTIIQTGSLSLLDSMIATTSFGTGSSGDLTITATDAIELRRTDPQSLSSGQSLFPTTLSTASSGAGNAGQITLITGRLSVLGGALVFSSATESGQSGNIAIKASGLVEVAGALPNQSEGSKIATTSIGDGNAGAVSIETQNLSIRDRAIITTLANKAGAPSRAGAITLNIQDGMEILREGALVGSTSSNGNAGAIKIRASNLTLSDNGSIRSIASGSGQANGGDIEIATNRLSVLNGSNINGTAFNNGNAGNLTINASESIDLNGTFTSQVDGKPITRPSVLFNQVTGAGKGGQMTLNTQRLRIRNGGNISASTLLNSSGQGGTIQINATESAEVSGRSDTGASSINAFSGGTGNAGAIKIRTSNLTVSDFGTVQTFAGGSLQIRNGNIERDTTSRANGGDIEVDTKRLSLLNGGSINASALNNGNAGNLTVNASESIDVSGSTIGQGLDGTPATIASEVSSRVAGDGKGGQITLNTRQLRVRDGGTLSTETFPSSSGQGGAIQVDAVESVEVSGRTSDGKFSSGIRASSFGTGNAGSVQVRTRRLSLQNNGDIATNAFNSNADSKGGEITINANTVDAASGGSIITATSSRGSAGDIFLNASDRVTLQGANQEQVPSGLFATSIGQGEGGNISIKTGRLEVLDQARVSVVGSGSGKAGDITIHSPLVRLADRGGILAFSTSTDGGNITINSDKASVLRRNSRISASAGTLGQGGDGGNFTFRGGFLVSKLDENNTIQANAFTGRGGNVSIAAQGIFGIQPASSLIPGLSTITASSELGVQGNISITQPEVQPTQGVLELPTEVLDASNQIAQVYPRGSTGKQIGRFVNSGRGSLPPSPIEPLAGSNSVPLAAIDGSPNATIATAPTPENSEIVEAQGWIKTANGKVALVAQAPNTTPSSRPTANCSTVTQQ